MLGSVAFPLRLRYQFTIEPDMTQESDLIQTVKIELT